jgi:hypothetical protein
LVSEFVARQLAKTSKAEFITFATRQALTIDNNKSFDGWVFQMDFLQRLYSAVTHQCSLELVKDSWEVPKLREFYSEEDLVNTELSVGCWFILTKINQGCYDVLQLLDRKLRVVQLTVAKTHTFKLVYVDRLLDVLMERRDIKIESLDIVIVTLPENKEPFKLGKVTGTSTRIKELWDKEYRVIGFKRSN